MTLECPWEVQVAHVELSLTESFGPPHRARTGNASDPPTDAFGADTAGDAENDDDRPRPDAARCAIAHCPKPAAHPQLANSPEVLDPSVRGCLRRWSDAVTAAEEPCLVLDAQGRIVAASTSCCQLLGLGHAEATAGRPLLDGVLRLVDFTAARNGLPDADIDAIPPLLALTSGRQARGLMRVHDGEYDVTVDGIAVPLREAGGVVGSLTFFSAI
ncbi:PAS domain-containing protein [Pilimelia columellifera]|uniref:PAS domain-containing protein n=1 Tax=Pilimelia columellifera subsp. columellifera TaxID=706583 RepID=A0ABP6ALJ3_9ACTN